MAVRRPLFWILLALVGVVPCRAGLYSDELAKCMIESTTTEDRSSLVRWMFVAASAHPAVEPIAQVPPGELEAANKTMAGLIMRLLTESCREQATKAVRFEGPSTFETSFSVLGQVAGKELFSSPEVSQALSGMEEFIDEDELRSLGSVDPEPAPPPP